MTRRGTASTTRKRDATGTRKKGATLRRPKASSTEAPDSAFVDALAVDFRRHGATAISRLREDDPVSYIKMCASVLPKAVIDSIDPLDSLTDEELHERARRLAEKAGLGPRPDPDGT
jgi:hypothetical protein